MNQLPPALRRYLSVVWIAALLVSISSWFLPFDHRSLSWPQFGLLLALLVAAQSLPRYIARGVKVSLDTIPIFIAVIWLPVAAAVSMAVIGVTLAQAGRRRPWPEVSFNAASTALDVYVGGVIYAALGWVDGTWSALAAALASAAALYLVNSSLISGAVAAQHRLTYRQVWYEITTAEPLNHAGMFLVGGLLVLPLVWTPVIVGLLLMMIALRVLRTRYPGWPLRAERIIR